MSLVNCEEPKVVGLLGFLSPLITKEPPLPPPWYSCLKHI